jgi:hypothetical protein
MLRLLSCLLFFYCAQIFAQAPSIEVVVDPPSPVINQEFDLIFKIQTSNTNEEPVISFNPGHADVLRKSQGGVSVSTTIIGGRFTSVRQVTYIYKMVTDRAGSLLIRDIKVEVDGKENKVRDVRVEVAREAIVPQEVFLMAEPSRNNIYVGEGIDVRYYLYFRVSVVNNEVTEFPKLNNFIKRFHMVSDNIETVEVNGAIYQRALRYSARLFPEKSGKLFIDPLKMTVQYSDSGGAGIGAFNFTTRRYKTRNIQSPTVEVNVLDIPTDNVPSSFTGLVGEHSFKLSVPRTKFLTNEVLEAKLEVEGPGALENLDAPKIISEAGLEEFDVRSEMIELQKDSRNARKVFDYTYLTREKINREAKKFEVSYFVPETGTFERKIIDIPSFEVEQGVGSGSSSSSVAKKESKGAENQETQRSIITIDKSYSLVAPLFDNTFSWSYQWLTIYKFASAFLFMGSLGVYIPGMMRARKKDSLSLVKDVFREKGSYSSLYRFLNYFFNTSNERMSDVIEKSKISNEAKKYFKNLVKEVEALEFNEKNNNKTASIKLEKKYFLEVVKKMGRS